MTHLNIEAALAIECCGSPKSWADWTNDCRSLMVVGSNSTSLVELPETGGVGISVDIDIMLSKQRETDLFIFNLPNCFLFSENCVSFTKPLSIGPVLF